MKFLTILHHFNLSKAIYWLFTLYMNQRRFTSLTKNKVSRFPKIWLQERDLKEKLGTTLIRERNRVLKDKKIGISIGCIVQITLVFFNGCTAKEGNRQILTKDMARGTSFKNIQVAVGQLLFLIINPEEVLNAVLMINLIVFIYFLFMNCACSIYL